MSIAFRRMTMPAQESNMWCSTMRLAKPPLTRCDDVADATEDGTRFAKNDGIAMTGEALLSEGRLLLLTQPSRTSAGESSATGLRERWRQSELGGGLWERCRSEEAASGTADWKHGAPGRSKTASQSRSGTECSSGASEVWKATSSSMVLAGEPWWPRIPAGTTAPPRGRPKPTSSAAVVCERIGCLKRTKSSSSSAPTPSS
mmetsp:Transcript_108530/g.312662  ORF Transcript_108530/g.312662 Transcript_108530/m.312662 type:complete len:202 (-) Transcript_108530:39-644(-)